MEERCKRNKYNSAVWRRGGREINTIQLYGGVIEINLQLYLGL